MLARHHGKVIKRNGRRVHERFAEVGSNFLKRGRNVTIGERKLVMIGGIFLCNSAGMRQLGKVLLSKACRKGFDGIAWTPSQGR